MLSYKTFTQIQAFNCPWFLYVVHWQHVKKAVTDSPRLLASPEWILPISLYIHRDFPQLNIIRSSSSLLGT